MSKTTRRQFDVVFCAALIAFAVVFAFSRSTRDANTTPIASAELAQLLAGNTLVGKGYAFYYAADGRMRGVVQGYRDTGVWSVRDDQVCVQWEVWGFGKQQCWQLWRNGTIIERKSIARSISNELTWHEGNIRNL